jgi:geranylgeranyl diphosphate synthase type II
VGGDIIENKKTFLYLKALENASNTGKQRLLQLFSQHTEDNIAKIESVKAIFKGTGADEATRDAINEYTLKAFATLDKIDISAEKKAALREFGTKLMGRKV